MSPCGSLTASFRLSSTSSCSASRFSWLDRSFCWRCRYVRRLSSCRSRHRPNTPSLALTACHALEESIDLRARHRVKRLGKAIVGLPQSSDRLRGRLDAERAARLRIGPEQREQLGSAERGELGCALVGELGRPVAPAPLLRLPL